MGEELLPRWGSLFILSLNNWQQHSDTNCFHPSVDESLEGKYTWVKYKSFSIAHSTAASARTRQSEEQDDNASGKLSTNICFLFAYSLLAEHLQRKQLVGYFFKLLLVALFTSSANINNQSKDLIWFRVLRFDQFGFGKIKPFSIHIHLEAICISPYLNRDALTSTASQRPKKCYKVNRTEENWKIEM